MNQAISKVLLNRQDLEARQKNELGPWAVFDGDSAGRRYEESPDHLRTAFQRDRDRIIHSSAFRRLEHKTQVFVNTEGDYYRTRLTHSLEASQVARSMARSLRLNEELTEAVILAHDLGHPPYGHAGEDKLNALMTDHGGFYHNRQTLRVCEHLERRQSKRSGLNLCLETRECIAKHSSQEQDPALKDFPPGHAPLEGQVADLADSIAYSAHDLDDALKAGILDLDQMRDLLLIQKAEQHLRHRFPDQALRSLGVPLTRAIIHVQVTDLVHTSAQLIAESGVKSLEEVRQASQPLVGLSEEMRAAKKEYQQYLKKHFYLHWRVLGLTSRGQRMIEAVFKAYLDQPALMRPADQTWCQSAGQERGVCDVIASMTDRYLETEYTRLFLPGRVMR